MTTITVNTASRVKIHRENMIKHGFKRVQKWIFDLDSVIIKDMLKKDLANYKKTKETLEWDEFALNESKNIENCE